MTTGAARGGSGRLMSDACEVMRDFETRDQGAVRDLVLSGLGERWGEAFDSARNPDLDDITSSYVGRGADVVVVDVEDVIVAIGMLVPEGDDRGRILRMSVDHGHRRRGFGRLVVEELVARARRRGMIEVVVLTDTPWTSAVALYRSCSFDEIGRDDTDTSFVMRL